jgi:kinesin family protein C1
MPCLSRSSLLQTHTHTHTDPANDRVHVPAAHKRTIECVQDIADLTAIAQANRSVAKTDMNAVSSRSHSVFTLFLTAVNETTNERLNGTLNLCDLAGSERLSRSGAEGMRREETKAINKSLSNLADVFVAQANKQSHIPFRNSKLTYLLQKSFSKNGKTLMFVNTSPTEASTNETLCSLRFATLVSQVELGKAKKQTTKRLVTHGATSAGSQPSKRSARARPSTAKR